MLRMTLALLFFALFLWTTAFLPRWLWLVIYALPGGLVWWLVCRIAANLLATWAEDKANDS